MTISDSKARRLFTAAKRQEIDLAAVGSMPVRRKADAVLVTEQIVLVRPKGKTRGWVVTHRGTGRSIVQAQNTPLAVQICHHLAAAWEAHVGLPDGDFQDALRKDAAAWKAYQEARAMAYPKTAERARRKGQQTPA